MARCNKPDPNLNLPRQAAIDLIWGFIETFAVPAGEDKRKIFFRPFYISKRLTISFELFTRARDGEPSRRVLIGLI